MTQPIDVHLDLAHHYGCVRFGALRRGEIFGSSRLEDPAGDEIDVVLQRSSSGDVIGVEVLSLAEVTLAAAAIVAREHDLAFPIETFRMAIREVSVASAP